MSYPLLATAALAHWPRSSEPRRWRRRLLLAALGPSSRIASSVGINLREVLAIADSDDILGKMKVSALLEVLPGVGKVRAQQIMEQLEIAPSQSASRTG